MTPHLPDGFVLTDDDGADLTGLVTGGGDDSSTPAPPISDALSQHFRGLSVFDASRANEIWAVGAERSRGASTSNPDFSVNGGGSNDSTAITADTPGRSALPGNSLTTSPAGCHAANSEVSSSSAPASALDLHAIWKAQSSSGGASGRWLAERLFEGESGLGKDSVDSGKVDDCVNAAAAGDDGQVGNSEGEQTPKTPIMPSNGAPWDWNESMSVSSTSFFISEN